MTLQESHSAHALAVAPDKHVPLADTSTTSQDPRPAAPVAANDDSTAPGMGHNQPPGARPLKCVRRKDSIGLGAALAILGKPVRYNVRAERPECKGLVPIAEQDNSADAWRPFTDTGDARLREYVKTVKVETRNEDEEAVYSPLTYGDAVWRRTLAALLFEMQVDPVKDWLEEQYALRDPDAEARLDTHLMEMFSIEDNDLNRWASRAIFFGLIHRTYNPGCKIDQVVVLIGLLGGEGKSAYTKHILPHHLHPEWHTDAMSLAANPKVQAEALDGRAVVELAEMQGSTRAEVEALKSFITRTDDGAIRRAYARFTPTKLRRFIFIGTSNQEQCLPNDDAALRRFVPIKLARGCNVEAYMAKHQTQIVAEAMHLYAGMSEEERESAVQIPPDPRDPLNIDQRERARLFRAADDLMEDRIHAISGGVVSELTGDPAGETLENLMRELGMDEAQRTTREMVSRVTKALKAAGWTKRRTTVKGVQAWRWFGPVPVDQAA